MKVEERRIFISDLPDTVSQTEVENAFNNYGKIISIEIKKRKEIGLKNKSLFAYVTIKIDDRTLQQCFKHFANYKWFGQNIQLQIAKEGFMDRLKRERAEADINKKGLLPIQQELVENTFNGVQQMSSNVCKEAKKNCIDALSKHKNETKYISSTSKALPEKKDFFKSEGGSSTVKRKREIKYIINSTEEEMPDLIIKNNRENLADKNGLKIDSEDNKSFLKIDKTKRKSTLNSSEANLKRLRALQNLKKNYQTHKLLIQKALSKIDSKPKNKIIFDDNPEVSNAEIETKNNGLKRHLFDDDQSDDEINIDFKVKEQFQGQKGEKLLALQSKYKNDKRFILDSRFIEDNEEHIDINSDDENSLREEKKKEYEILEQILGKTVKRPSQQDKSESQKKGMLRFDPSQPNHSKFELKNEIGKEVKRKENNSDTDIPNKNRQEEEVMPTVSKEIFYKVTDNLKETLHEKQEFSLLTMFGKANDEKESYEENVEDTSKAIISNKIMKEKNPFKYDSSDDESEIDNTSKKDQAAENLIESGINETRIVDRKTHWCEPFFFKKDDYRLQEGFDFIEKMKGEERSEFSNLRRNLKEIVKAKVRNNQKKHKPFKKKLGGSKRKKIIRMKKALKR